MPKHVQQQGIYFIHRVIQMQKIKKNLKIKKANYFAFIIMKIQSKQVEKELQMNVQ